MWAGTAGVKDTLLNDELKIYRSKIDLGRSFGPIDKAPGAFAIVTNGPSKGGRAHAVGLGGKPVRPSGARLLESCCNAI